MSDRYTDPLGRERPRHGHYGRGRGPDAEGRTMSAPLCAPLKERRVLVGGGARVVGTAYTRAFAAACRLGMSLADARDYAEAEAERVRRERRGG